MIQIINREPSLRGNICYKVGSKGRICDVRKNYVLKISSPFEELKKENKSVSNIDDLPRASELVRQRHLAKMRILRKQQSGGYVLVGSLTCIGTFLVGSIIFMAIKFILMK